MKKLTTLSFFFISIFYSLNAQQLEVGVYGGYSFHNITNTKISEGKAVIGDPIWDFNKGLVVSYYFKDDVGIKLSALFSNVDKGSKSEKIHDAKFQYNTSMLGILIGFGGNIGEKFRMYADLGFGYTMLDTDHGYNSLTEQTMAFNNLEADLEMNSSEYNFLFDLGAEYVISSHLKLFLEMYTDPAVYRFNKSQGKYQNQGIGFNLGIKYFVNFRNQLKTE